MREITIFNQSTINFALHYTEHFYKKLRDFYLKLKLGGYRFYETELEKLVQEAIHAMPHGSAEKDALLKASCELLCNMPLDSQKGPEAAATLNTLSNKIFGKDLLPKSSEITVKYLIDEMIANDAGRFPAYAEWLRKQLLHKKHTENLKLYINTTAEKLHHILSDSTHDSYQELMGVLEKMSDRIPGVVTSQPADTSPIESKLQDLNVLRTLLHLAFDYHLKGRHRSHELLKVLDTLNNQPLANNPEK